MPDDNEVFSIRDLRKVLTVSTNYTMIPAVLCFIITIVNLAIFPKAENRYFKLSLLTSAYGLIGFMLLQSLTSNIGSPDSIEYNELLQEINKQELKISQASLIVLVTSLFLSSILSYIQVLILPRRTYSIVFVIEVILTLLAGYLCIVSNSFLF